MSENPKGWDSKPKWRVVEASPKNHNPLIEDILKPLQSELKEVLRVQLKEFSKKIRGK